MRSAVLKQWKGYSYRELHGSIKDNVTFRWFTRFYSDPIPHFTSLQKSVKAIQAETWTRIHAILVQYAKQKKVEKGQSMRVDTTVVEANIAYPVDARLLWDSIRVLTRVMERCRRLLPNLNFAFAKRTRKGQKTLLCNRHGQGCKGQGQTQKAV